MKARVEITKNALKHGMTVFAGGIWYRIEQGIGFDTSWHIINTETGAEVGTAPNQSALRYWLHQRGRRRAA